MVKKFKAMAREAGSDGQLASAIKDSAQQIWLAGLGAFSKAQEEGQRSSRRWSRKAIRCTSAR